MRLVNCAVYLISCLYFGHAKAESGNSSNGNVLPVVLWHGMGDTCCFPFSLGSIKKLIMEQTNVSYVRSLEIGANIVLDYESGFFIHPNKQVDYVCKQLAQDEQLSNGYNAIGFSQGAQFLRAVAQRCPVPRMRTLISLGGQHQGVFGLPKCPTLSVSSCEHITRLLNYAAYEKWVQNDLVQATYWHDPLDESSYRLKSSFLADINNELYVNERYAENLNKLTRFVMVKFLNDTIVQPKETQWFEFYAPGQDKTILPLNQSKVFNNLGLELMNLRGKLQFLSIEGDHLAIPKEWFVKHLVPLLLESD
ncbi:palmitoyl-protein thioesterase 1 [Drosophila grimshawi]|uniref:Palmitoyl-protein thioesterase 1 n=1 Tax=Drosophila grimshawi TaxID=7222 RepID=B4JLT5_DROGR|nr:palmitoyl-protein thioesterase 1 [Drosophila grimshawi]EDV91696.1 GH24517 [Drosophila grimshawi]